MATTPARRLGHVPALDGLRGVAIALVLGYHAKLLSGGLVGVDVFFVLSGFLITSHLLEERQATGRLEIRRFYARRARRLLPGLVAFLLALAVISAGAHRWTLVPGIATSFLYTANLYQAGTGHLLPWPLMQMWSLAQEEQFYLVWPFALLWWLRRGTLRRLMLALALAFVAVVAWRSLLIAGGGASPHATLSPDTRSDGLLLGCLLAAARFAGFRAGRLLRSLAIPGLVVLAAVGLLIRGTGIELAVGVPLAALAATIVLADVIEGRSIAARLLGIAPLRFLGAISYSVYLWHLVILQLAPSWTGIAVAVLVGAISYRCIEEPFRNRRSTSRQDPVAAVAAS